MIERRERDRPSQDVTQPEPTRCFNREMLRVARGARGFTQKEFADLMGVKQNAVSRWEDGLRVPSDESVEGMSINLGRTAAFFYQHDRLCGIDMSFMFHRKRKRTSASVLRKIHDQVNIRIIALRRLLRNVEEWPVRFERMDVDDEAYEGPQQIARLVRAMWTLPFGPIPDLVGLAESAGAIVFPMDFSTSDVDGIGVRPWDMPPVFFINPAVPADRQRWSLAHEIGHIIMHEIPSPEMETEADQFASELLMPTRDVLPDLEGMTLHRALRLKPRWRVSAQSLIRKARDTGMIRDSQYKSLSVQVSRLGYRKREPVDITPETPTTIQRLTTSHCDDLGYQMSEVSKLAFYRSEDEFREEFLREQRRQSFRVVSC